MLPPLDALVLYAMMREYRPQKMLEIGSGFSTEIALMAANHTKTAIQCIDPELDSHLMARESQLQARIQKPVQEVDLEVFAELQAGDFLFIDTTHTVKLGSDVNHLIFNVLPRLASGVFVHFHDIFLPYEYPRRWYDEVSIFWNEQYLLLAYLLDNPSIELLLPNYALSHTFKDQLSAGLKEFNIWGLTENSGGGSGASFWLRKI
jgi:predicted O-methyltransferase YrrM